MALVTKPLPEEIRNIPTLWERLLADDTPRVVAVLELVLLYHQGGMWGGDECTRWDKLLDTTYWPEKPPSYEATTVVLCDAVRHVLGR